MTSLHTILVPHDFSRESRAAFGKAEELAAVCRARIHLLHAVDPPMLHALTLAGPVELALPDVVVEGALAEAEGLLHEIAEASPHEVEVHVVEGAPTEAICSVASRIGADLIVMGTHGRQGVDHLLHGSVAERTLRAAPCPVLAVRDLGGAEPEPEVDHSQR